LNWNNSKFQARVLEFENMFKAAQDALQIKETVLSGLSCSVCMEPHIKVRCGMGMTFHNAVVQ